MALFALDHLEDQRQGAAFVDQADEQTDTSPAEFSPKK
jgi:hypothetical protein